MSVQYKRTLGVCEICGTYVGEDALQAVTLAEPRKGTGSGPSKVWHDRQVAWICDQHPRHQPLAPPRETTFAGTSRKRPRAEQLFDYIPPAELPS